jgi:tetratricopeptide (TPR) repeat protein
MQNEPEPAGRARHELPLVGRDDEVSSLRRTAQSVRDDGQARIVTVVGPNGVGKTSIIDAALRELAADPSRNLRVYRGSARGSSAVHAALASLLRSRFALSPSATPDEVRAAVRDQVASVLDDRKVGDVCFFLGQILDIPFPDSPLTKALGDDPTQGRMLRRAIIKSFFESDASRGALCLVFDDLDAAGEDSIGLVSYLVEHVTGPVLVVCSMRPEMPVRYANWFSLGGTRHSRLDVGPLPADAAAAVMRVLLAPCEGGPPLALVDAGVRHAGGNVGLLRAMVRLFQDSGVLSPSETAEADVPSWHVHLDKLESVRLPVTVEDTVSMRIAALSPVEQLVLERAASMGSVFWVGAIAAIDRGARKVPGIWELTPESESNSIEATLGMLEQRDYVQKMPSSSFPGETQYAFQHKLERQKLSALTEAGIRRGYHQTVADWLVHKQPDRPSREHLALLAYHLESAGLMPQAGLLYLDAADAARTTYAARDADEHYTRGLSLLGSADARRRIDALHNHGDVLATLGRTDEALTAFREMLALAYRLDVRAKGGAAHNRIGRLYRAMGALPDALQNLETALALFDSVDDERGVAACHDDVGMLLWTKGEYEGALDRMRTALEMRKNIGDRRSIALSLHNIGVVWRDHGRPTQAREALEASLQIRREIGDLIGVAQTLDSMGRLAQDQRDLSLARELFKQAHDVAREVGERNFIAVVLTNLGEVHYRLGETSSAIRILTEAEELCDELGDRLHLAEAKRGLAKAYLMQGDLKRARVNIKHAVDVFGQIRSKSHLASALRTLGEITAAGAWGPAHEGKSIDYFMRSIALCKEIGNEIEIAKSYRSFSDYVAWSTHYQKNDQIQSEAKKLRAMSDDIFTKQRIAAERAEA